MEKKKKIIIASAIVLLILITTAKPVTKKIKTFLSDSDKKDFINLIYPQAKIIGNKIGVPPLFILAQIALESGYGKSTLSTKYFNYGGIKATGTQKFVTMDTTECKGNICKKIPQKFAVYPNIATGLEAQSKVLTNAYFKKYTFKTNDAMKYANLLQSGAVKYATQPDYVNRIKGVLEVINRLLT